jgi:dTDP-glucose 4,6-dehydratase
MRPRSPYAAAKAAGDRLAYGYAVTYAMKMSILRPSNIYGPGQRVGYGGAVIPTLTRLAMVGEPVTLTGGGEQSREWLHIDDLVAAYTLLLDRMPNELGEAYNVGSGEIRSIKEIGTALCQMFPSSGSKLINILGRPADVSGFLLDSTKFRRELNWSPQVKFDDGLARYVDWVKTVGPTAWL